jgi:hypothetical protein
MGDVTESVFPPNALGFVSEKLIHEHVSQDITKLLMTRQSALGPVFSSGQEIERARERENKHGCSAQKEQDNLFWIPPWQLSDALRMIAYGSITT